MMFRRCVWASLVAAVVLGSLGTSESQAFLRRGYAAPSAGMYYADPPYGYYYTPYFQPLPAAGILPLPLATEYMLYGATGPRTAPRSRPSVYPKVPYEKSPTDRQADMRRVRFEITVPYADAIVKFDGVATKQAGLNRVFVTPPMQEDKQYTVTIVAQWPTPEGTLSAPRTKTFTVVAGETVQHAFKE